MKGEFYDTVEIVSKEDAWDAIIDYHLDDIISEMDQLDTSMSDSEKWNITLSNWYDQGISHYEGWYLRKDGRVERELA